MSHGDQGLEGSNSGNQSTDTGLKQRLLRQLSDYLPPYIDIDLELDGRPHIGVTVNNSRFVNKDLVERQIEDALGTSDVEYTLIWNQ